MEDVERIKTRMVKLLIKKNASIHFMVFIW